MAGTLVTVEPGYPIPRARRFGICGILLRGQRRGRHLSRAWAWSHRQGIEASRCRVRQQLSSSVKSALAQHRILSCGIDFRSHYRFQTFCTCRVAVMVQAKRDEGTWPSARERHWRRELGHGIRGDHRSRLQNLRVPGFLHAFLHRAEGEELLRKISGKEGISRRRRFILSTVVSIMWRRRSTSMASRNLLTAGRFACRRTGEVSLIATSSRRSSSMAPSRAPIHSFTSSVPPRITARTLAGLLRVISNF